MSISVLIVEDELITRMALAMTLRAEGLEVLEAVNADEAWSRLERRPVDLVFSDVRMHGTMDGVELARRVRARFPATRVILTSGHYVPREAEEDFLFLPKPYELSRMSRLLADCLEGPSA